MWQKIQSNWRFRLENMHTLEASHDVHYEKYDY